VKSGRAWRRLAVAGLGLAGVADALYMLAFHEGLIDSLACPFFGEGCEKVGRSPEGEKLGIPHAAAGAVVYAGMAALALWGGDRPPRRRPWQPLALGAVAGASVAAHAYFAYAMKYKVKAWCFWCLTSTALSTSILALSAQDAVEAAQSLKLPPRRAA
jgi:uncharacterized membrane protein